MTPRRSITEVWLFIVHEFMDGYLFKFYNLTDTVVVSSKSLIAYLSAKVLGIIGQGIIGCWIKRS